VGVGGVVREFFEWVFVWGDVDPHGCGLGACEPDGCTVVVEVRATELFEGLGGGVEEAHACEVVFACLLDSMYSRRRKSQLILREVVMTAGRKKKLRSL
jgi:hypothetical protein